ncbi:MAG: thioesterase family protein [Pseudomonadota bacterium]
MSLRKLLRGECDAPEVLRAVVLPEWIDVNGHMNVAWYTQVCDLAIDALWQEFGITDALRNETGSSTFAVESHIRYLNEIVLDEHLIVQSRILGWDAKRLHQIQYVFSADSDKLAATCEWLHLHVNLNERRVAPWPPELLAAIAAHPAAQLASALPVGAGDRLTIETPLGPQVLATATGGVQ